MVNMRSNPKVLFVFPYDWLTSPRSTKEVAFLKEIGYEPIVVWTNHRYITSGKNVSASPQFDGAFKELPSYRVPFFVIPLDLAGRGLVAKICTIAFYLMSTTVYSLYLFALMLQVCVTKQIRLIHVHNSPDLEGFISLLVSKITGTPYIFEIHDHTPELYAERMGLQNDSVGFKLLKIIERSVVSNSSGNIFVSKTSQKLFEAEYNLGSSASAVIYSGPPRHFLKEYQYNDKELEAILNSNSMFGKFIILYLGSMEEGRRGLEILVEGMGHLVNDYKLSNLVLVFVGDGYEMIDRLRKLAFDCKVSAYVSFQGKLPRKEAYKWLTLADVVVDPLRGRASTIACVTNKDLEYMAAHKVIVASDMRGHREMLSTYDSGLLFADGDSYDLSKKLLFVINNSGNNVLEKMRNNAWRGFSERFCWEEQESKLLRLYAQVLANHSKALKP
jgi:glycosyltransferase involved in cell wall biosynthesis